MHLAQGLVRVEPVERLADGDRVHGAVGERDRSAVPSSASTPGRLLELVPHLGIRLDRDDVRAARDEQARQLAGARARGRGRSAGRRSSRSTIHATAACG